MIKIPRKVTVVSGRAYDVETGAAIGYRSGESFETGVPTLGKEEAQRLEAERKVALEEKRVKEAALKLAEKKKVEIKKEVKPKVTELPTPPPSEIRPRPKAKGLLERWRRKEEEIKFRRKYREVALGAKAVGLAGVTFVSAAVRTPLTMARHPIRTIKGIGYTALHPFETLRYAGKRLKESPAQFLGEIAGQVAVTYGIGKGVRKVVPKRPPKIAKIETRAIAVEEARIGRGITYRVAAKPKVFVKRLFRKPKVVKVEVAGRVGVQPTLRPKYYEARGIYAGRLPKKPVTIAARAKALIKRETPIVTKQVTAAEVYLKAKPKVPQRFVSAAYGVKGIKVPKGEVIFTYGQAVQLLKKGKVSKPFVEKGITIVKKLPKIPKEEVGFGIGVRPKVITKAPTPIFAPTIAKIAKEVVIKAPRVKYKPRPIVIPRRGIKPSIYEGLGLYERTEEFAIVTPKGLQIQAPKIRVKEKLMIQPKMVLLQREKTTVMLRQAQQVGIKTMTKQKLAVVQKVEAKQLQKVALRYAGAAPRFAPQVGVFPYTVTPIVPSLLPKKERPRKYPSFKLPEFERKEQYIPSLVGVEQFAMGLTAPVAEKRFYKDIGVIGLRPVLRKIKKKK